MQFVGRQDYLERLDTQLAQISPSQGRFVAVRGRRQVGKSRLLTEWLRRRQPAYVYHQAVNRPMHQELAVFRQAIARSNLGTVASLAASGARWDSWDTAFDALRLAADEQATGPVVVVIDELPYIIDNDPGFEATLQAAWDHRFQHAGVLLIVVGSDLAMMEALTSYERPLYGRVDTEVVVRPLNVAEVADLLSIGAREAFDTYLMTGGFPKVVASRAQHGSLRSFLAAATADEAHPLVFTGQRMLDVEFPPALAARTVLEAVGHGERVFSTIRNRAGVTERTLSGTLAALIEKRVIVAADPLSERRIGKRKRYTVADPYLRFWLRFLAGRTEDIARGRGDLVAGEITAGLHDYAGSAVEPIVRDAIERLLPDVRFGGARYVGAYWGKHNDPQVDLVGTASKPGAKRNQVEFAGTVKWRARKQLDWDDVTELDRLAEQIPGWRRESRRVGVSRTGFAKSVRLDVMLTPEDLLVAWQ